MNKYQVIFDLEANTEHLEAAYAEAERLVSAGASALGRPMPLLTVAARVDPPQRSLATFSVEVPCGPTRPRGAVTIAFNPRERGGAVIVYDGDNMDNTIATYPLTARGLQWMVRGLMLWPLDMLDDMAREDEVARRRAGRGGES
jgi:hypothetical protein